MRKTTNRFAQTILALLLAVLLIGCETTKPQEHSEDATLSERQAQVVEALEYMDALISPSTLEDPLFQGTPFVTSRVEVTGLERPVSVDWVDGYLNAYRFFSGKELDYTGSDLVHVLRQDDERVYNAFVDYFRWLHNGGNTKRSVYSDGIRAAYKAYRSLEGKDYQDKKLSFLNAKEDYELALWAQAHPGAADELDEEDKTDFQTLLKLYQNY